MEKTNLIPFFTLLVAITMSTSLMAQMSLEFTTTSAGEEITLPLYGAVNCTVNWGDSQSDPYTTSGSKSHEYTNAGTYTVTISSSLTQFGNGFPYANVEKLIKVNSFGDIGLTSLGGAFYGATNLTHVPTSLPSGITDLSQTFRGISQSTITGLNSWDVSNVLNMSYMFMDATAFNQDISGWVVSSVTNMSYMFYRATAFNQNIGGWGVGNVTNMSTMFNGASSFNQDISGWDVSKVENMTGMFWNASAFNQDIGATSSDWNVSGVTNMQSMFKEATAFNGNISNWDVGNVTNMSALFTGASDFNQDISGWDVSSVEQMVSMFWGAYDFNQDIGGWTVGEVATMYLMFRQAFAFDQDISDWDVSSVTNLSSMFYQATNFDQDIGDWDVSKVTNATDMFYGVTLSTPNYNSLLIGWDARDLQNDVTFHGGNSKYSPGAAADAKADITKSVASGGHNWTITDGGEETTADISFTDGSTFSPAPTPGNNDQPIGRFSLLETAAGSIFTGAEIILNGARTGASNFKLWKSTDNSFGSDTQLGSTIPADPGVGIAATFSGFTNSLGTSTQYFFITCDVAANASGVVQGVIADNAALTFTSGSLNSNITNATLSNNDAPLPVTLSTFTSQFMNGNAILNWTTQSESNNLGWNVYRSDNSNLENALQINYDLIPGWNLHRVNVLYL